MSNYLQIEKLEWIESLRDLSRRHGEHKTKAFIKDVLGGWQSGDAAGAQTHYRYTNTALKPLPNTVERSPYALRVEKILSWNTTCMVIRAGKVGPELGGHIATFQSIAYLYEVGFDYFFRARNKNQMEDLVFYQGHSIPGIYARSFLMHELDTQALDRFRQESQGGGLSSYPHPWLMPSYWQFPTVSMGLGPAMGIYQARLMKYLQQRELIPVSDRKVWVFCGDGEMLEPESTGLLATASRDKLSNLIFVVSCNLQELDGLVNANGNVIRELAGLFAGANWRVIQLIWNEAWEALFRSDTSGQLLDMMTQLVDGEFQNIAVQGTDYLKDLIKRSRPSLSRWVDEQPPESWAALGRAGHDWGLVYRAFNDATQERYKPVVILAKTVKGHQMGSGFESVNVAHQKKKLTDEELVDLGHKWEIPLPDDELAQATFYRPEKDHEVTQYLLARRQLLGGMIPKRHSQAPKLPELPLDAFAAMLKAVDRPMSTTMAFVRILGMLLRQKEFKEMVVPMVPDEARTFGMEGLFKQLGIYAPEGQKYKPHDHDHVASYHESPQGQFLQEGLCEAGAISSWIAAATAYANHKLPLIPFYVFYSMFGFQRVGDFIWAAADSRARGFLIGATAGRTTLAGEGLQHNDGHSHVLMSVVPNCEAYDPAFAYELAGIMQDGLRRMYTEQEDVFYYITVMNENYVHPAMPENATEGILRGMYCLQHHDAPQVRLLGSGTILREVIKAADWFKAQEIAVSVWSVTSFTKLGREGVAKQRAIMNDCAVETTWVESCLPGRTPTVAATDYMRAYADQIRSQLNGPYTTLGTDGFGCSDTRARLRDFHEVSAQFIIRAALAEMLAVGGIDQLSKDKLLNQCNRDFNS